MENNEILKDLVLKKEDKVVKLKQMIGRAKTLFQIDEETKKVLIDPAMNITSKDKIVLFLVGRHFQKELGMTQKNSASISEIGDSLNILQTSLSAPLLELRERKILIKDGIEYSIPYQEIERNIERIYLIAQEKEQQEKKTPKRTRKGKRKESIQKRLIDDSVQNLIDELKISEDEIKAIYSIRPDDFVLIKTLRYDDIVKLHLDYVLLITFAYRTFYGIEQVDSTELRNKMKDTGCPSITNLSTNLKNYSNMIIHDKGRKGSIYTNYRITQQGIEYTKNLITALVKQLRNYAH